MIKLNSVVIVQIAEIKYKFICQLHRNCV